jgi:uncharacterized protein YecA (UPF0149 family)
MMKTFAKIIAWLFGFLRKHKDTLAQPKKRKPNKRDKYGRKCVTFWNSSVRGTYRRPYRKVGRNDLCPCDSGVKFKKCHGKAIT